MRLHSGLRLRPDRGATRRGRELGVTLVEELIAIALVVVTVTVLIQAMANSVTNADRVRQRAEILLYARSQLENIAAQPFASSYSAISTPADITITVNVSVPRSYSYPAPKSTAAQDTVQKIVVTAKTDRETITLDAYRTRRPDCCPVQEITPE